MPPRLLFTEWSPARWRTAFLFFGLIGTILLAGGVYSLVTLLGRTAAAQASRGVRQCSGMTPEGLGY
jgi:hypothetical protein